MATSTLDPDNIPEPDRQLGKGHGNDALGPSDISDTGSDVQGGLKAIEEPGLGLERGTSEDADSRNINVSRDTEDASGTGETSTAGRNADVEIAGDIDIDRIDDLLAEDEIAPDESVRGMQRPSRPAESPSQPKR